MSIVQQGQTSLFNGDQVIKFTTAKKVKSIQGYQDLPSMEAWYKEDPMKRHLGMQKFFGNQTMAPTGIFPELLSSKAVLEVNGVGGSFTYDVPMIEATSIQTTRDTSDQVKPGLDGSPFKLALNREFTTGDILTNDAEFGQQVLVSEEPVEQYGDSYIHTVKLVSQDKTEYFLSSALKKGITWFKLNHAILGEYGTNFSHVDLPSTVGHMTCEFTLGDLRGVEAYVTGMADKKSFSGAAMASKEYLGKLQAEAEQLGELAVIMDVDKSTMKTLPGSARIGATMQYLVFRELDRLTAQSLLFQRPGTFRENSGVVRLNEGLWHQLRRGKIIKYARPMGITRKHIKEAVEYVFRSNPYKRYEERRVKFKCGLEALNNVLEIFSNEVNAQLSRLPQFMGADRNIPNPISGTNLHEMKMDFVRFTEVYLPQIGYVKLEHDPNLDYSMMQDRFSAGFHGNSRAHTTYSMVIWDAEDQEYSNNAELPKGAKLVEEGNANANVFLVKPEGEMMYWGTSHGRYSINKASDIVSSHKQIGQEFWAWNSCAIWVRDITRFVMIELNESARKGYN
jgi:hypothetical protein